MNKQQYMNYYYKTLVLSLLYEANLQKNSSYADLLQTINPELLNDAFMDHLISIIEKEVKCPTFDYEVRDHAQELLAFLIKKGFSREVCNNLIVKLNLLPCDKAAVFYQKEYKKRAEIIGNYGGLIPSKICREQIKASICYDMVLLELCEMKDRREVLTCHASLMKKNAIFFLSYGHLLQDFPAIFADADFGKRLRELLTLNMITTDSDKSSMGREYNRQNSIVLEKIKKYK